MTATNFDLAPPKHLVDGLDAVPIDIQHVTARLTFDGATSNGAGDARLDFVVGPGGGAPIFDLRQTITAAWLDGTPIAPAKLAHHDFGGGANAELRIVDTVLAAGSAHTLRVTYTLGVPQASAAGTYQPAMTWSAGPRLAFNFGFTDLGAGRYLEAWVPANLIFDQFDAIIDLELLNTAIPHTVITNGSVVVVGANHWTVSFPARFTALSTLLEVRATDTLASASSTAMLPATGAVTIEAWKLTSNPLDLNAQVANLASYLSADESAVGKYPHGNRFVAFVHVGGMEYEGGTTSSPASLRHETFHSWFGRGAKPAAQADGWWDEAWDVYNDFGGAGILPLDFTAAPVELSSRNPWTRVTPLAAYSSGERLFEGFAALLGVAALKSHMGTFFAEHTQRPTTTAELEALLVRRSGEPTIVDAFHRFVYGFVDPAPPPDLWIRDDPGDPGSNFWAGRFWDSPDLWIRNVDDGGTTHQPVESGQDNWFYARVRNRSTTAMGHHFVVAFNVKTFLGTEFVYPGDFLPCVAATAGFDLGPGQERIVKARWPAALVPAAGTHACWLASVLARGDPPRTGVHVWEHNNLAQKNLAVVDLVPDAFVILPIVLDRFPSGLRHRRVELLPSPAARRIRAGLLVGAAPLPRPFVGAGASERVAARIAGRDGGLDCAGGFADASDSRVAPVERLVQRFEGAREMALEPGRIAEVPSTVGGQIVAGLRLHAPPKTRTRETFRLDVVERDDAGRVVGGVAVELRVREQS
jgi:hypothetical protein